MLKNDLKFKKNSEEEEEINPLQDSLVDLWEPASWSCLAQFAAQHNDAGPMDNVQPDVSS